MTYILIADLPMLEQEIRRSPSIGPAAQWRLPPAVVDRKDDRVDVVPFRTSRMCPGLGLSEDYDYRDQRSEAPCRSSLSWESLYRDAAGSRLIGAGAVASVRLPWCNWRASDTGLSRSPKTTRRYSEMSPWRFKVY